MLPAMCRPTRTWTVYLISPPNQFQTCEGRRTASGDGMESFAEGFVTFPHRTSDNPGKKTQQNHLGWLKHTLPETNIAPEKWWLGDDFPFGMAHFQVRTVSFSEGNFPESTADKIQLRNGSTRGGI